MIKKVIFSLFVLLIFWFLAKNISGNLGVIRSFNWNFSFQDLLLIFVTFTGIYLTNILSWQVLLKAVGVKLPFIKNLKIWLLSNATRLLPGGIWQYPSKIVMLEKEGVKRNTSLIAVIMETLFTLSFGSVIVFATLPFWGIPEKFSYLNNFLWLFLASPILAVLMLHPKLVKILVSYLAKIRKTKIEFKGVKFSKKDLIVASLLFFLKFLVFGVAFFVLFNIVYPLTPSLFPVLVGTLTLSWIIGFLAVFAPAGLGVTELTLVLLLSPHFPLGVASLMAVVFRVALLLFEGIFLVIALSIRKD